MSSLIIFHPRFKSLTLRSRRHLFRTYSRPSLASLDQEPITLSKPFDPKNLRISSEWGLEVGLSASGVSGELESPSRESNKNPSSQESLFEDVSSEIPSRTSNPMASDPRFNRHDQKACGFPF